MDSTQYNISVVHSEGRLTQSWILSETPVADEVKTMLIKGHHDVLNMMIAEKPMIVYPLDEHIGQIGRITETTSFINPKHVSVPLPTLLVNSPFFETIEGDTFFEKLCGLEPLLDEFDVVAQSLLMNWHTENGTLFVGVV